MNRKAFATCLGRLRRRLGLDQNPIRRRTDRLESAAVLTALTLIVVSLPLALGVGFHTQSQNMTISARQYAARHQTEAVLTDTQPMAVTQPGGATVFLAQAEWTTPDGVVHDGKVQVPATAGPGSVVDIWTTAAGTPVDPPLTPTVAVGRGALATAGTVAALAILVWCGVLVARWRLDRRRLLDWDVEWRRVSPRWT